MTIQKHYIPGQNRKAPSDDPLVNMRREKGRRQYVIDRYGYDPEQIEQSKPEEEREPTYAEQMAYLLNDEALAKDTLRTKDVSTAFGVTSSTVLNWRKRGWLHAVDQEDGHRGAYYYAVRDIQDIQKQAAEIIPYTKRYWMRIIAARKEGRPIR